MLEKLSTSIFSAQLSSYPPWAEGEEPYSKSTATNDVSTLTALHDTEWPTTPSAKYWQKIRVRIFSISSWIRIVWSKSWFTIKVGRKTIYTYIYISLQLAKHQFSMEGCHIWHWKQHQTKLQGRLKGNCERDRKQWCMSGSTWKLLVISTYFSLYRVS